MVTIKIKRYAFHHLGVRLDEYDIRGYPKHLEAELFGGAKENPLILGSF